jgi:hypothetical protein
MINIAKVYVPDQDSCLAHEVDCECFAGPPAFCFHGIKG